MLCMDKCKVFFNNHKRYFQAINKNQPICQASVLFSSEIIKVYIKV